MKHMRTLRRHELALQYLPMHNTSGEKGWAHSITQGSAQCQRPDGGACKDFFSWARGLWLLLKKMEKVWVHFREFFTHGCPDLVSLLFFTMVFCVLVCSCAISRRCCLCQQVVQVNLFPWLRTSFANSTNNLNLNSDLCVYVHICILPGGLASGIDSS